MRRSPFLVEALERAVLESLAARPGQTRAELCEQLGSDRRALDRPVINLVQSGRVRRTGHKAATRYWPAFSGLPPEPRAEAAPAAAPVAVAVD